MADRITLLDINLNVAGASDALKELQLQSTELAKRQAELKNAQKDLNNQLTESAKAYKEGSITQEQYSQAVEDAAAAQTILKVETMANNKAISENNSAIKANITVTQSQEKSIDEMRAKLALVSKEWSKLTENEIQNTDKGKELSARKKQLTEDLKRLEAATGDTRRNVGNYTDSILQAANSTKAATGGVAGLTSGMAGSINGIKAFNATLAANPAGAIVMAVMLLIQWIEKLATRSSSGGNEMKAAFAPIKTIFDRILDVVGRFFEVWMKGVALVINTAVKVADALGLVSDETKRMADEAARLTKEERDIYNTETERIVQLQRLNTEINKQKELMSDQSKSAAERQAAGKRAIELIDEETRLSEELAKRKYDLIVSQNALSNSTDEDLRKEAEALVALEKVRTDGLAKRKELYGQVTGFEKQLRDQALAQSKTASDARARAYEEAQNRKKTAAEDRYNKEIDLLNGIMQDEILRQRMIRATTEVNSEYDEQLFHNLQSKKLDILSRQLEEGKITLDAYNQATYEMEVERVERIAAINEQARAKELEQKLTTMQLMQELEEQDITNQFELQRVKLEAQMAQELSSKEYTQEQQVLIEKKYSKEREKIAKAEANAKLTLAGDLAGQLSTLLGEETVAGKMVAISQATINTYLGATKALAQGGFFGIAQAAVVVAAGLAQVSKIVNTKAEKPEIEKPTAKYERGGKMAIFGGNRHSEGGTILRGSDGSVLEVERGEAAFVLNRSATGAISALSALNQAHGGNSFSVPGLTFFANGGMMQLSGGSQSGLSDKDMDRMTSALVYAISSIPAPIVTVSDINNTSDSVKKITQISQL